MAQYRIELQVDAPMPASVEKKLRDVFGQTVPVHTVEKLRTPESRADRLSAAESDLESALSDAKDAVEELKGEMEEWRDSIPENLQNGDKAQEVNDAISELESLADELDNLTLPDFSSVSFPSMF